MNSPLLPRLLEGFFLGYLSKIRGASPHTIHVYRDSLRLFLDHVSQSLHRSVDRLDVQHLRAETVLSFLDDLERRRGNGARTRNCRLMALRAFFKHALRNDPAHADQYARILSIASKKAPHPICTYLEPEEVKALLAQPSEKTQLGIRDYGLLLFLYNTGARVSEALGVRLEDIQLNPPRQVRLRGKGKNYAKVVAMQRNLSAALKQGHASVADFA